MSKYIVTIISCMILSYIGYLIFQNLSSFQYAFATIWGGIMTAISFVAMDIIKN